MWLHHLLDVISGNLDHNDRTYIVMRTMSTKVARGNEDNLERVSSGVTAIERCGQRSGNHRGECNALLPPHCEEARRGHEEEPGD